MPIPIFQVKMTKVLHLYFSGFPQMKIGEKCGIHQSTASRYAQKFVEKASAKGIVAAAKEYGIMEEVMALRSLATELYKSKTSIEEAKSGVKMVILFNSLGVPPEEFKVLAKMFKKLKDPDFPKAGMKLIKLEEATSKEYTEIISEFEKLDEEIAVRQEKIANLQEKQDKGEKALEALELGRKEKEEEVAEFLEEAEKKKAAADAEVKEKLDEAGLTLEKVAKLHPVVEKMNGLGISDDDIETFVDERQVLEEKGITWEKFQTVAGALAKAGEIDANGLAEKLAEFGTLDQAINSMKADLESLQPRVEELKKEKEQLENQVDGLGKKKVQQDEDVEHSKALKESLDKAIDALPPLEKLFTRLERDVSILETKKAALTEEVGQKEKQVAEMDEKLKKAGELDKELKEKEEQLQERNSKIAAAGQKYELFESFLGLVNAKTIAEVEDFLKSAPLLVKEAKTGKYDPGFMVNTILAELSGGTLDQLACQECEAEFVIVKSGKKIASPGMIMPLCHCPKCGGLHTIVKEALLVPTLKKVIFMEKQIVVKKQGGDVK